MIDSRCGLHCTGCPWKESCGCGGCIERRVALSMEIVLLPYAARTRGMPIAANAASYPVISYMHTPTSIPSMVTNRRAPG